MNKLSNKLVGIFLSLSIILGNGMTVLAEDASVNANSIDTIKIETVTPATSDENLITNPSDETTKNEEVTITETHSSTSTDGNLKDDLYDGNILVDKDVTVDGVFEKLIVKGRELVENVRKAVIPWLVLAWIALFAVSVLRILTGERGASSRLVGGLVLITIAYCGIVYAEVFITNMVNFFVG